MHDQNNVFYAVALSLVILITWQYFFATSFLGRPSAQKTSQIGMMAPDAAIRPQPQAIAPQAATIPSPQRSQPFSRQDALARSQRVAVDTPRVKGSIALTGGRIDDLSLVQYRETTDPKSPAIQLLSPSGGPQPFYAEFGWINSSGINLQLPTPETKWRGAGISANDFGRRQIPLQRPRRGRQQRPGGRRSGSLCIDLPSQSATDAWLLSASRRRHRGSGRPGIAGSYLQDPR